MVEQYAVSIHAPWEGCDAACELRSSYGHLFQFTHPGKGATRVCAFLPPSISFQFTHPGKGATRSSPSHTPHSSCFNSRTLGRVRHRPTKPHRVGGKVSIHAPWEGCDAKRLKGVTKVPIVSIHAPWEGCDVERHDLSSIRAGFNSRTLGRVRLGNVGKAIKLLFVSIHAPWEGCDPNDYLHTAIKEGFNSRTLGRVRQCGAKLRIIGRINKRNLRLGVLS